MKTVRLFAVALVAGSIGYFARPPAQRPGADVPEVIEVGQPGAMPPWTTHRLEVHRVYENGEFFDVSDGFGPTDGADWKVKIGPRTYYAAIRK